MRDSAFSRRFSRDCGAGVVGDAADWFAATESGEGAAGAVGADEEPERAARSSDSRASMRCCCEWSRSLISRSSVSRAGEAPEPPAGSGADLAVPRESLSPVVGPSVRLRAGAAIDELRREKKSAAARLNLANSLLLRG